MSHWCLSFLRIALLLALCAPAVHADEHPVLLTLQALRDGAETRIVVRDAAHVQATPEAGAALAWRLIQGEAIETRSRPNARVVQLFQTIDGKLKPLCRIEIVYFEHKGHWLPRYRVHDELILVRDANGQLRPVNLAEGLPALIQYHSDSLPNPEGYYPSLEFGLTTGPSIIAAWRMAVVTSSSP